MLRRGCIGAPRIAGRCRAFPDSTFVLVETSHPGNIGAVARAMKNMGLADLWLVRPKRLSARRGGSARLRRADVLEHARVVDSTLAGIAGCGLVLATTARERDQYFRVLDVRDAAVRAVEASSGAPVALLFGPERTGLTNEDLALAHALLRIPANPEYASLNLAMAVQLVPTRSCGRAPRWRRRPNPRRRSRRPRTCSACTRTSRRCSTEIDFRDRTQSGTHLMNRIRRFLQRAELDANEVNILRGILTAVQQRRRRAGAGES